MKFHMERSNARDYQDSEGSTIGKIPDIEARNIYKWVDVCTLQCDLEGIPYSAVP